MPKCDLCGNEYDEPLVIRNRGQSYTFDCFECAIHVLAPTCATCGCRIIGHGVQTGETIYCCAHCAEAGGADGITDRT